jgi:hypothetical protein
LDVSATALDTERTDSLINSNNHLTASLSLCFLVGKKRSIYQLWSSALAYVSLSATCSSASISARSVFERFRGSKCGTCYRRIVRIDQYMSSLLSRHRASSTSSLTRQTILSQSDTSFSSFSYKGSTTPTPSISRKSTAPAQEWTDILFGKRTRSCRHVTPLQMWKILNVSLLVTVILGRCRRVPPRCRKW